MQPSELRLDPGPIPFGDDSPRAPARSQRHECWQACFECEAIRIADVEASSGHGLTLEANYGRRLLDLGLVGLTGEVPFVVNFNQNVHYDLNLVPKDYKSFFVTPSIRANLFPDNGLSPWVSVGGGFGYFKESSSLEFFGPNPGKTGTTSGVFQVGAGLDIKLLSRLSLRGQVRDFFSGIPQLNVDTGKSRQHNFFVGGGVVWHF